MTNGCVIGLFHECFGVPERNGVDNKYGGVLRGGGFVGVGTG